jgi:serine/threonine protein kinase
VNERSIFMAAVATEDPAQRSAYLDEACGGDAALRRRVEALLASHEGAGSFLGKAVPERLAEQLAAHERPAETRAEPPAAGEGPAPGNATAGPRPTAEGPGSRVGPYKLLREIGEGGMGTVYLAEQSEPVRRTVALKIIKAGMDSRQVIARFEAERQALALMDHPNIARVLDAGTTENGRPYFVMELVKGVPITRYCDEHRLTPRQRLELFVPVCQALQHAHQKGIIHRDLKPSNVLVCLYDGRPVPKVIGKRSRCEGDSRTVGARERDGYSAAIAAVGNTGRCPGFNGGLRHARVTTFCTSLPPRRGHTRPDDKMRRRVGPELLSQIG